MHHSHILVKVYAHIWPAEKTLLQAWQDILTHICSGHTVDREDMLCLEGDLLRLSYEGIYFPTDDFLEILRPFLYTESQGKLDYIDLEEWTLTRHSIQGTTIHSSSVPLNNVLDYSGH